MQGKAVVDISFNTNKKNTLNEKLLQFLITSSYKYRLK